MARVLNEQFRRMQKLAGIITEGLDIITEATITYVGPTEDQPYRKEILIDGKVLLGAETTQDKQGEIAQELTGENSIDQMYEPSELAGVLGYDSVRDLAKAYAEKIGATFEEQD